MNDESRNFAVEQVETATPPPRARVEDAALPSESAAEKIERKKDYLEGFLAVKPEGISPTEPGGELYEGIITALREIFDPEIPVNIYELGLIYAVEIDDANAVKVEMTLTAPGCPSAQELPIMVRDAIMAVPYVSSCTVDTVWDPPWDPSRMTEDARLMLNMF